MARKDEPVLLWWSLVVVLTVAGVMLLVLGAQLGQAWVYANYR